MNKAMVIERSTIAYKGSILYGPHAGWPRGTEGDMGRMEREHITTKGNRMSSEGRIYNSQRK